jgi:hypothetical protein
MTGDEQPTVRVSTWWGVPTGNGKLVVLLHIDDPRLVPVHARMREMLSRVFADMIVKSWRANLP